MDDSIRDDASAAGNDEAAPILPPVVPAADDTAIASVPVSVPADAPTTGSAVLLRSEISFFQIEDTGLSCRRREGRRRQVRAPQAQ